MKDTQASSPVTSEFLLLVSTFCISKEVLREPVVAGGRGGVHMLIDLYFLLASSIGLQASGELREGLGVWFRGVGEGTVRFFFLVHWMFPFPSPKYIIFC